MITLFERMALAATLVTAGVYVITHRAMDWELIYAAALVVGGVINGLIAWRLA